MTYRDALRDRSGALLRVYSRTVGVIQLGYAFFFGWIAFKYLSTVVQVGGTFKGVYFPAINVARLCYGTIAAVLFLIGIIGGCGLFCLRRWVRPWETAYFVLVFLVFAAWTVSEARREHEVGYIALFATIAALPYMPFLLMSPPAFDEAPRGGETR